MVRTPPNLDDVVCEQSLRPGWSWTGIVCVVWMVEVQLQEGAALLLGRLRGFQRRQNRLVEHILQSFLEWEIRKLVREDKKTSVHPVGHDQISVWCEITQRQ